MDTKEDMKYVITVGGHKAARTDVKQIPAGSGKFYLINKECFLVNDRWVRLNSGLIAYNLDEKKFILDKEASSSNKFKSKLIIAEHEDKPIYGYTSAPIFLFRSGVYKGELVGFLNKEECKKRKISIGDIRSSGIYGDSDRSVSPINQTNYQYSFKDYALLGKKDITEKQFIKQVDSMDLLNASVKLAELYHNNAYKNPYQFKSNKEQEYNELFNKITFGIEIESANNKLGVLSELSKNGLVPLRDGSIEGFETATFPHTGLQGMRLAFNQIANVSNLIHIAHSCSIHIHVAGRKLSQEQILALFCLSYRLQEEFLEFIHPYKRNISYLKNLRHEYSEPLKSLNIVYNKGMVKNGKIVKEEFNSAFTTFCRFITKNSSTELADVYKGAPKYRIDARYWWVNFVNLLEKTDNTVEFRIFPPSNSSSQIVMWAELCKMIYTFAAENYLHILSDSVHFKMHDIIQYFKSRTSNKEVQEYLSSLETHFYDTLQFHGNAVISNSTSFGDYNNIHKSSKKHYLYPFIWKFLETPQGGESWPELEEIIKITAHEI